MHSMSRSLLAPLPTQAGDVLAVLAADTAAAGLRVNDLCARTGLGAGHVGRHLRTLERDRLARYQGGAWHATLRGLRHAPPAALAAQPLAA